MNHYLKELKINTCKIQTITQIFKLVGKVRHKGPLCTNKLVKDDEGTPLRTWREKEKTNQTKTGFYPSEPSPSPVGTGTAILGHSV